jgi:predicted nucleic acid-binding protein
MSGIHMLLPIHVVAGVMAVSCARAVKFLLDTDTCTLIAAPTVARKLTLVSNNEREFRRVAGLEVENCRI